MATGTREHPLSLIQFPFAAGIDQGNREEVVEAGAGWLALENGRQDHRGGYSTRNGFTAMATGLLDGSSPTSGYKMFADRDTTVRICDGTAQVFDAQSQTWASMGRTSECAPRLIDLPALGIDNRIEDVAIVNGYACIVWLVNGATFVGPQSFTFAAIINLASGATVVAPVQVGTLTDSGAPPNLATNGNSFIIARANAGSFTIQAHKLDTTSAATITTGWVAMTDLATDLNHTNQALAICSLPAYSALVYVNSSGGASRLTVIAFTTAGVLATQTLTSGVDADCVDIQGSAADTLWVAWNETTNVKLCGLDPASITNTPLATTFTILTVTTGATTIAVQSSATAGQGRIWATDTTASALPLSFMRGFQTTAGAVAANGAKQTLHAVMGAGRPTRVGARFYMPVIAADEANAQQQIIVIDWTDDMTFVRPVAAPAPGLAVVNANVAHRRCSFVSDGTGRYYFGIGIARTAVSTATALVELDFNATTRWQSAARGNSIYLTGGLLQYSDGRRIAEVGFLVRPSLPTVATSGTGITATIGWRYVCVYEEVDSDGNWHVSGLSSPSASTGVVSNKTVTATTQPLTVTMRQRPAGSNASGLRIAFYRTLDGGVAPYYRVGTVVNNTGIATAAFVDTVTDAVLAANAKLYSQPGELGTAQDRRPPPGLNMLVSYNGMLVGASGSDVWYSGQSVSGEGAWFNPIFQVPIPGDGDITALWAQDGTLFVAKRHEVYAITGEAPSDSGSSGGLSLPRRLAVDVGCIEPRSPCVTAFGTFFQSDRGIEILTRAQSVEWIGEPIQDSLADFPIVTSATVDPGSCTVLIECTHVEENGLVAGSGCTLIYDLSLQKWVSTDFRKNGAGVNATPSQSACIINTSDGHRYAWLAKDGAVHVETDEHLDADNSMVCKRAVSAHVKASGFQGLQHVNKTLLLAKDHTPHDLEISFAYNYAPSFDAARTYTAAEIATLVGLIPNLQIEHPMSDEARCEAVRVQIQDVTPSSGDLGTGQGSTWIALAFEVVPMTGAYNLPDAAR